MARLGLKIYFLRTRIRGISQGRLAGELGVRQATISHIERGRSQPTSALLLELSRYFDVTPSWLVDEERGLHLRATDRWSLRNQLVTAGMWIEVPRAEIQVLDEHRVLVPLLPGEAYYDEDARVLLAEARSQGQRLEALDEAVRDSHEAAASLATELQAELEEHPRRRRGPG